MKHKILSLLIISIFLVSCGGGSSAEEEFKFYSKKEVDTQQLDLTVEASGTVEAISSIEIKSKASGEILYLGCLLYTSPSPRDLSTSRMPSSA